MDGCKLGTTDSLFSISIAIGQFIEVPGILSVTDEKCINTQPFLLLEMLRGDSHRPTSAIKAVRLMKCWPGSSTARS